MLELDDIQHILLTRTPAMTGRYEFLSFDHAPAGRAWLSELLNVVESAASARDTMDDARRWVTLGFTWTGLRALGVPEVWRFDGEQFEVLVRRDETGYDSAAASPTFPNLPIGDVANLLHDVVTLDEPKVLEAYQRRLVLVRPDGHVAWRDDVEPHDARAVVDCVRGAARSSRAGQGALEAAL